MSKPLVLYSAVTWLALTIARDYYDHTHYAWCSSFFDDIDAPPSSRPAEIYRRLWDDVHSADRHSEAIPRNKIGILKGATKKRSDGVITDSEHSEIIAMVEQSEYRDFLPWMLIIPFDAVEHLAKEVEISKRAHAPMKEYIVEDFPGSAFHAIELPLLAQPRRHT